MGEHATHPIAHFLSRPASLLLLTWNGHAASSRLAGQLKKCTLGRVQLRNLGSTTHLLFVEQDNKSCGRLNIVLFLIERLTKPS
jgi:hypothetical protein